MRVLLWRRGFHGRPGRDEQRQADGEQRGHRHGAQRWERRTDDDAGDGRTHRPLEDRTHHAFDTVGREQLVRRQNPRQDRAVGGEEERRRGAQSDRAHRQVPDLQRAKQSEYRDRRRGEHVDRLDRDDDRALVESVGGNPADQHERDQGGAEARRHDRQRYGIVVEFDDLHGQHHREHAVGEDRQ
ncbi:hypothetical protein MCEL_44640 [Mycolicibacterium celeriflavum]|uniref:Uncharacterized protein n=1 Tax=Mycolicibacterium celeriflavum TaxID=1249101 RepID=A0A7I7RQE9_MYCCF|nr:hypothetical protein MCEL_44640 [Mycolicibacterium celeriflavum]